MRKLNALLIIVLLFTGVGVLYSQISDSCAKPLHYSIGAFDARFGLTQKEFLKIAAEAEKVWEEPAGKDLFIYDPDSNFKINLVYDERQKRTDEYEKIKRQLERSETGFKSIEEEYTALVKEYDEMRVRYDSASADFERDLARYNESVDYWNSRDGAPEVEYTKLRQEEILLDLRSDELEGDRQELNAIGRRINILAERGNNFAQNYNNAILTYNQRFGTSTEFDQGDYQGDRINIYQFRELSDLRMVVAHELGHTLGIDHVDDPKAVMHYFMGEQNIGNLAATEADIVALFSQCKTK